MFINAVETKSFGFTISSITSHQLDPLAVPVCVREGGREGTLLCTHTQPRRGEGGSIVLPKEIIVWLVYCYFSQ